MHGPHRPYPTIFTGYLHSSPPHGPPLQSACCHQGSMHAPFCKFCPRHVWPSIYGWDKEMTGWHAQFSTKTIIPLLWGRLPPSNCEDAINPYDIIVSLAGAGEPCLRRNRYRTFQRTHLMLHLLLLDPLLLQCILDVAFVFLLFPQLV